MFFQGKLTDAGRQARLEERMEVCANKKMQYLQGGMDTPENRLFIEEHSEPLLSSIQPRPSLGAEYKFIIQATELIDELVEREFTLLRNSLGIVKAFFEPSSVTPEGTLEANLDHLLRQMKNFFQITKEYKSQLNLRDLKSFQKEIEDLDRLSQNLIASPIHSKLLEAVRKFSAFVVAVQDKILQDQKIKDAEYASSMRF